MLTWHYITRATFDAASAEDKDSNKLFFLSDTGEIYRGTQNFTESVILYTEEPTVKAVGKLYVNSTTLEGKIWNGNTWVTVIQPIQTTLDATNNTLPVSGKAVGDYVSERINEVTGSDGLVSDVTYTAETNSLNVTMADGSSEAIPMTNVAADLVYDKNTGLLQVKNAQGTAIGTGINLDLERFVSEASYDPDTKLITLKFNDEGDPINIDIGALVDTYTAGNSTTVSMTVTGNQFVAEAIIATTEGNLLQKTDNGLYVAPVDLSGKMDKDIDAVSGNLAKFDENGNAIDSGLTAGGDTLASEPSVSVLVTEAAVAAIRTALQNSINTKMNKVEEGKVDELLTATADGHAKASGFKVGGATLAETPDSNTVATEAAVDALVKDYAIAKENIVTHGDELYMSILDTASDEKVISEKYFIGVMSRRDEELELLLSWQTTI